MARSVATDFLHSMRFQVVTTDGARPSLTPAGRPDAGFTQVTTPEATAEAVEYKEGTMIYVRKYPGSPTIADISMMRGVARRDSSFWDWMRVVLEGSGEYRQDLDIKHFHREDALTRDDGGGAAGAGANLTQINSENPARIYHVREGFITRHKSAGDLDATASEISIMEMDVAYEHFEIEELAA